ncbi:MAG: hypothetical protein P1U54_05915 [Immundisolibacteraceae bacterium]|nr:hypothetical protein [Immundisolibacteraceae bacterium]
MMERQLPEGFEALERFGPKWFADTEKQRHRLRTDSSPDDLNDLYEAVLERFDEICAELDQHPLTELSVAHQNLLNLALSFMEVSLAVEAFKGAGKVPFGFDTERWEVHF